MKGHPGTLSCWAGAGPLAAATPGNRPGPVYVEWQAPVPCHWPPLGVEAERDLMERTSLFFFSPSVMTRGLSQLAGSLSPGLGMVPVPDCLLDCPRPFHFSSVAPNSPTRHKLIIVVSWFVFVFQKEKQTTWHTSLSFPLCHLPLLPRPLGLPVL